MMVRGRLSGRQVAWEELEEPSSHDDVNEGDASPPKVNSNLSSLMRFSEKRRETRQADFASIARARAAAVDQAGPALGAAKRPAGAARRGERARGAHGCAGARAARRRSPP